MNSLPEERVAPAELDNEQLVPAASRGDEDAFAVLVSRMAPRIQSLVACYRRAGADDEDLAQESLVGLLAAVRSYHPNRGASFATYASVCIRNRLITVVRQCGIRAAREQSLDDEMRDNLPDTTGQDPAQRIVEQEAVSSLPDRLQSRLTPLEYKVLLMQLSGHSYDETAVRLNISKKSVDNAIQRLRRKLSAGI